jgi:predicted nucleic acid-binding protein
MSQRASHPLFVDTNALVAAFNEDDKHHDRAEAILDGIRDGDFPYGPIFTSRYVLSETATTILFAVGHQEAVDALETVQESSTFNVLDVGATIFDATAQQFTQYDDQDISFIDYMNSILAREYDIEHIFAFDGDFATLGLTRVPTDTGEV